MGNMVDKDIQSMLRPLNLMPNIMLYSKYFIRDNYIIPNTKIFKGLCATIVYLSAYTYRVYESHKNINVSKTIDFKLVVSIFDFFSYTFGYFMIFFINVIRSKSNIKFVLIYQDVHRFLVTKTGFQNSIIENWIFILLIIFWYTCIVIYEIFFLSNAINTSICDLLLLIFEANFIYAIRLIKLVKDKVILMNGEILSLKNVSVDKANCIKIFQAYDDILKCYDYIVMSFRLLVSDIVCITSLISCAI